MKACVVLRKLADMTVVSTVILEPKDPSSIDDLENYFKSEADDHIQSFCSRFVEFKPEHFTTQIVDTW